MTVETLKELEIALNAHAIVAITDAQGVISHINNKFCEISQYSRDELIGKTHRIINSGYHSTKFFKDLWATISSGEIWNGDLCNRAKDGSIYWVQTTIVPFLDGDGRPKKYIAIRADITLRKQVEQRIYYLARHDALTDLPNRTQFYERLKQIVDELAYSSEHVALLALDLDNFKDINDRMGHGMGDKLLIQVANILRGCIREEDVVARLGGDEFVVLFTHLDDNPVIAEHQAESLAQRIRKALDITFDLDGLQANCSCSVGLRLFNRSDKSKTELIKQADMALYKAKEQGRNTVFTFTSQLQSEVLERSILLHDLQQALSRNEFYLHYQAIVNKNQRARGFEALIRWQHPTRGLLAPGVFIEIAEDSNLIIPIGQWVLETACKQLVEWSRCSSTAHLVMFVNVSALQFEDARFVSNVRNALRRTGANPSLLCLELTESVFLTDVEKNIRKMEELRAIEVRFALDDFGTGYSSLQHLKRLPLDLLKLDASFVKGLPNDSNDVAITETILALAHTLNLRVVAEGVETEAQFMHLLEQGCDVFQGYYFARPAAIKDLILNPELPPAAQK